MSVSSSPVKKILLASPRGFCAGVSRAIAIVERVLEKFGSKPVYVLHEVVHNRHVVQDLAQKGVIFVENIDEVPDGSILIFSAHGVSVKIEAKAKAKNLKIFDATCPIVDRVHRKVRRLSAEDSEVIMIGHSGHQEVEGTLGQYTSSKGKMYLVTRAEDCAKLEVQDESNLHFVTQTTLSVDETKNCIQALQERFHGIAGPCLNDICYATQNRQQAVKTVAQQADVVLVVGSKNSSNSNRLSEVARTAGCKSFLIDDYKDITPEMLADVNVVAVTGGASAPECLINDLLAYLLKNGFSQIEESGSEPEKQNFKMPSELM